MDSYTAFDIGDCFMKEQALHPNNAFQLNRDAYMKGQPVSNPEECANCKLASKLEPDIMIHQT